MYKCAFITIINNKKKHCPDDNLEHMARLLLSLCSVVISPTACSIIIADGSLWEVSEGEAAVHVG